MSNMTLQVKFAIGTGREEALNEAKILASKLNLRGVEFPWNNRIIVASPRLSVEESLKAWDEEEELDKDVITIYL